MRSVVHLRKRSQHNVGQRMWGDSPIRNLRNGAEGGFVATVVMTAFRLPISRSLPPTDEFWRRYVHDTESVVVAVPALLLHSLYGVVSGVIYALFVTELSDGTAVRTGMWGVATAILYGVLLSAFGQRVVLDDLLGQELQADEAFVFHLGHVVYGITLGAWTGSRRRD